MLLARPLAGTWDESTQAFDYVLTYGDFPPVQRQVSRFVGAAAMYATVQPCGQAHSLQPCGRVRTPHAVVASDRVQARARSAVLPLALDACAAGPSGGEGGGQTRGRWRGGGGEGWGDGGIKGGSDRVNEGDMLRKHATDIVSVVAYARPLLHDPCCTGTASPTTSSTRNTAS